MSFPSRAAQTRRPVPYTVTRTSVGVYDNTAVVKVKMVDDNGPEATDEAKATVSVTDVLKLTIDKSREVGADLLGRHVDHRLRRRGQDTHGHNHSPPAAVTVSQPRARTSLGVRSPMSALHRSAPSTAVGAIAASSMPRSSPADLAGTVHVNVFTARGRDDDGDKNKATAKATHGRRLPIGITITKTHQPGPPARGSDRGDLHARRQARRAGRPTL